MVLAAGFGTRLRPLTDTCAKALVPVGDRPALAHVVDQLVGQGITRIAVNAHHRADDIRAFLVGGGTEVEVSEEAELLGTAGGLAKAASILGEGDALVWNADTLAEIDLRALVDSHAAGRTEATLVVEKRPRGEGPVGVDESGRIVRLRSERSGLEAWGGEYIGISLLGAALRKRLPERGCLVGDTWIPAMRAGAILRAYFHDGPWRDIGTLGNYLSANLDWLGARRLPHWTGAGAHVAAGIRLDQAVLGAGAAAAGSGLIARCVLWPGAHASAPLSNAIVMQNRIVPVGV